MLIQIITFLWLVVSVIMGQLISPCPDVLRYEPRKQDVLDRWTAEITLNTDVELEWVWIKIILDRKADILGNWFSDAESKDNKAFSLRNFTYQLKPGPPTLIRFFVKYNPASVVPSVSQISLNGRIICPGTQNMAPSSKPTQHDSDIEDSSSENLHESRLNIYDTATVRSTTTERYRPRFTTSTTPSQRRTLDSLIVSVPQSFVNDDDDFFEGDFNVMSNERTSSRPTAVTPSRQKIECGTNAQRPSALISFGEEAAPGQWPWHVALYVVHGTELKYICGGTLVSENHVVTAAHCVTKRRANVPVRKEMLVLYLGKYNLVSWGAEVQDRQIEEITVHPEFNATLYFNDIAVLRMDVPAVINDYVRPCCLWEGDSNVENIVGQKGTVIGWGFSQSGQLSKNLMQAKLPVVSTATCLFSNRNFFSQFISDKNFCAGYRNDTSVCNGDSGGSMVFPKPGSSGQKVVWQLRGIISLGVARQNEAICDSKQYSILTDAAKYVPWIKDVMRD